MIAGLHPQSFELNSSGMAQEFTFLTSFQGTLSCWSRDHALGPAALDRGPAPTPAGTPSLTQPHLCPLSCCSPSHPPGTSGVFGCYRQRDA